MAAHDVAFDPPRLRGYVTAAEAAEMFDPPITRQAIHKRIRKGEFRTAKSIGSSYIIKEYEVERAAKEKIAEAV